MLDEGKGGGVYGGFWRVNGYRLFYMYMNKYASHIEYLYIYIYIVFIYLYLTFIACQISRIRSGHQGVNTYILNIHIFHTCCARFIPFHFVSFHFIWCLNVSSISYRIVLSYRSAHLLFIYIHIYGSIYESKSQHSNRVSLSLSFID